MNIPTVSISKPSLSPVSASGAGNSLQTYVINALNFTLKSEMWNEKRGKSADQIRSSGFWVSLIPPRQVVPCWHSKRTGEKKEKSCDNWLSQPHGIPDVSPKLPPTQRHF